jgi:hypothetical protein
MNACEEVGHMSTHTFALPGEHDSLKEGAALGLIMASITWVWAAIVDALAGVPFHTFATLGGIAVFTVLHYILNMVYGVVIMATVHASKRTPSLIIGGIFVFLTFEFALAMATILLTHLGLGELAWLRVFGASLIASALALAIIAQRHPLAARLHEAEAER